MLRMMLAALLAATCLAGCSSSTGDEAADRIIEGDGTPMNIFEAALAGDLEASISFLQSPSWDPSRIDSTGATPLVCAAKGGHPDIIRLMVQVGANVNEQDGKRNTPLKAAEEAGNEEAAQALRELGATQ